MNVFFCMRIAKINLKQDHLLMIETFHNLYGMHVFSFLSLLFNEIQPFIALEINETTLKTSMLWPPQNFLLYKSTTLIECCM